MVRRQRRSPETPTPQNTRARAARVNLGGGGEGGSCTRISPTLNVPAFGRCELCVQRDWRVLRAERAEGSCCRRRDRPSRVQLTVFPSETNFVIYLNRTGPCWLVLASWQDGGKDKEVRRALRFHRLSPQRVPTTSQTTNLCTRIIVGTASNVQTRRSLFKPKKFDLLINSTEISFFAI